MNITAIQISEKRQKVKTSDESIKMRKFISMAGLTEESSTSKVDVTLNVST